MLGLSKLMLDAADSKAEVKLLKRWRNEIAWLLKFILPSVFAIMVCAPFILPQPTLNDLSAQCRAECKEIGRSGRLVKKDLPASTKWSSQDYECTCY